MRRSALVMLISAILCGCGSFLAEMVGESVGVPLREKVVREKVEPNLLVAMDGTTCEVAVDRWNKAKVGSNFLCVWSDAAAEGAATRHERGT